MTARQQALRDIREDLREQGKCFIAFRKELNPIMKEMVNNELKRQKHRYEQ